MECSFAKKGKILKLKKRKGVHMKLLSGMTTRDFKTGNILAMSLALTKRKHENVLSSFSLICLTV